MELGLGDPNTSLALETEKRERERESSFAPPSPDAVPPCPLLLEAAAFNTD
jgi:hypothetical protein